MHNPDFIRMAQEAGIKNDCDGIWCDADQLETFAKNVALHCAKICDDIGKQARKDWKAKYNPADDGRSCGAWECEEVILEWAEGTNEDEL